MQTFPTTSPATTTGQPRPRRIALVAFTFFTSLVFTPGAMPALAAAQSVAPSPPSRFHGNWRVVARDDVHAQALMRVSVQHSPGERRGSGDYALFQPFCDALAHAPITGSGDCEAIGAGDAFERVQLRGRWLVMVFRPTADGQAHTLAVRRAGDRLVGEYRNADGARAVVLEPVE